MLEVIASKTRADKPHITVLFPCLNEELTLGFCINEAIEVLTALDVSFEIVVADNGSEDLSCQIAEEMGARVVHVEDRGYGNALRAGLNAATGQLIFILDADGSYSLENLAEFMDKFEKGYDFVLGNRFMGKITPGAMPLLHQYLGNPILSYIGKKLYSLKVGDFHSGIRAITGVAAQRLQLVSGGMEFASEMILKAAIFGLRITEVPVTLYPDKRNRKPHLRTWHDGWRHLKFLLYYAPNHSLIVPGRALFILNCLVVGLLSISDITIQNITFSVQTQLVSAMMALLGFQLEILGHIAKLILHKKGLGARDSDHVISKVERNADRTIFLGFFLILAGFVGVGVHFATWLNSGLGFLDPVSNFRTLIPFSLVFSVGMILSAFGLIKDSIDSIMLHR